jgi:hypothetical protein
MGSFLSEEIFASISGLIVKGKSGTVFDAYTRKGSFDPYCRDRDSPGILKLRSCR